MGPDRALIYSILNGGIKAFNSVKQRGIKAENLFGDDSKIFQLLEEFIPKGRLPSLEEIALFAKVIVTPQEGVYDTELCAEAIYKRALTTQINDSIGRISDVVVADPYAARKQLQDLIHSTIRTHGKIRHSNSASTIEEIENRYLTAESRPDGLLGLSSPFPSLDKVSLGLQKGELHVIFAKRKVGKSVGPNSLVCDALSGIEHRIEDLVKDKNNSSVLSWKKDNPIYGVEPIDLIECGKKECVKITWKSGREITTALTHPFLTTKGWSPAHDLKVGLHTGSAREIPEPLAPKSLPERQIILLAYLIADGGFTTGTVTYTKTYAPLLSEMRQIVESYGCNLAISLRNGVHYGHHNITSDRQFNPIKQMLLELGLMGKKSIDKFLPDIIFSLPNNLLGLFLGRMWSGDGSIEKSKVVSYITGSKRLAFQIQHLLLRFGITSKVRTLIRNNNNLQEDREYYEIAIHRVHIEAFKKNIKLIGEKADKVKKIKFLGLSRVGWLKTEELKDVSYSEISNNPGLLPNVGAKLNYSFTFQRGHLFDVKSNRTREKVFKTFCDAYNSSLKWVVDKNIWWDEVVSIAPAGYLDCYDLEIPETHCYLANDFIVHNSNMAIAWMEHIWRKDCKPGDNILIVTMEMPPWQVNQRIFATRNKLDYALFRSGKLLPDDRKRFMDWCKEMKKGQDLPQVVVVGSDVVREVSDIVGLAGQYNPKIILVDGFYILGKGSKKAKWERTLDNAEALKLEVASALDVPVMATTQLSGAIGKQDLDADTDGAAFAKGIGDFADASYGLFMDDMLKVEEKRILRVMDARDFIPIDLQINFSLQRQDFSEIKVLDGASEFKPGSSFTDLPDFAEGDQLAFD